MGHTLLFMKRERRLAFKTNFSISARNTVGGTGLTLLLQREGVFWTRGNTGLVMEEKGGRTSVTDVFRGAGFTIWV